MKKIKKTNKIDVMFTNHAIERFLKTSSALGLKATVAYMKRVFERATPECPNEFSAFYLFKRGVKHGNARYMVAEGWRFVVVDNRVVTVERTKPHENYKYLKNFMPSSSL